MWVRGREVKGEQKIIYGIYTTSSLSLCLFFFFRTTFSFYLLSDTFHVHDFNWSFFFLLSFLYFMLLYFFLELVVFFQVCFFYLSCSDYFLFYFVVVVVVFDASCCVVSVVVSTLYIYQFLKEKINTN